MAVRDGRKADPDPDGRQGGEQPDQKKAAHAFQRGGVIWKPKYFTD